MELKLQKYTIPLNLREKLEIEFSEDLQKGLYVSRIEDFSDDAIIIDKPEFIRGDDFIRNNAIVTVFVAKEDAVYTFPGQITRIDNLNFDAFRLVITGEITRVQRRRFSRVQISDEVLITKLPTVIDNDEKVSGFLTWKISVLRNISGGGVLVRTKINLKKNDLLLIKFGFFGKLGLPQIIAGICRRVKPENNDYLCGIEFIETDNLKKFIPVSFLKCLPASINKFNTHTQNLLVNYVFQQQVKLRQKGLI